MNRASDARMDGDFLRLLPENPLSKVIRSSDHGLTHLEATTVFAFHYADGVMMAGDHRATAGNMVFSDRVEKILQLDGESMMAIAGSPAVALEMARTLQTSFEFYRRSQLQPMSLQAKTRALSRLLKDNLPALLNGVGMVVPLFAGLDRSNGTVKPTIFFYDPLGAQFDAVDFAASGSGSQTIRSVLSYLSGWGQPKPCNMSLKEAVILANRLLMTAAEFDTATGGVDPAAKRFATIYVLTERQIESIPIDKQAAWWSAGQQSFRSRS